MVLEFSTDRPPLPPVDLIDRVSRPFTVEEAEAIRQGFDSFPEEQLQALERALALVGKEFADFERLLDFGCGPGRYLRLLGPLAVTTEIHGADVDADAIQWLRDNVTFGEFSVIPPTPPTAYDDGEFDLVINHSVFTHIDVDMQDLWLAELRRITAPDGILLLTVHSSADWERTIRDIAAAGDDADAIRSRFERDGVVFVADDHFVGSTHPEGYHTAFHAPGYVFEHWGAWLDVVAYMPLGAVSQDLVVLRRPADERPPRLGVAAGRPDAPDDVPTSEQLDAAIETLASRIDGRTAAVRSSWWRRRAARAEALRQRTDNEILDVLRGFSRLVAAQRRDLLARNREIAMLRVGIYEQGRRMSLIAHQLRDELTARDE